MRADAHHVREFRGPVEVRVENRHVGRPDEPARNALALALDIVETIKENRSQFVRTG